MSAAEIAKRHFAAAISDAGAAGVDKDSVRNVADVQSELRFVAENCDPETDFMFMRP